MNPQGELKGAKNPALIRVLCGEFSIKNGGS